MIHAITGEWVGIVEPQDEITPEPIFEKADRVRHRRKRGKTIAKAKTRQREVKEKYQNDAFYLDFFEEDIVLGRLMKGHFIRRDSYPDDWDFAPYERKASQRELGDAVADMEDERRLQKELAQAEREIAYLASTMDDITAGCMDLAWFAQRASIDECAALETFWKKQKHLKMRQERAIKALGG